MRKWLRRWLRIDVLETADRVREEDVLKLREMLVILARGLGYELVRGDIFDTLAPYWVKSTRPYPWMDAEKTKKLLLRRERR